MAATDLAEQIYLNVGTGIPPGRHRVCACVFEYPYRWPQFYDALLAGDLTAVDLLDERDHALEQHFHERCGPWDGAPPDFQYPTRWPDLYESLLSGIPDKVNEAASLLDDRDRALEDHIKAMPCFGVDYAKGITCEFHYPYRWPDIAPGLRSGNQARINEAVALLDQRDIELETNLTNRLCGDTDEHGLFPDSVSQIYLNVTA